MEVCSELSGASLQRKKLNCDRPKHNKIALIFSGPYALHHDQLIDANIVPNFNHSDFYKINKILSANNTGD